jgi:hypothetical protein
MLLFVPKRIYNSFETIFLPKWYCVIIVKVVDLIYGKIKWQFALYQEAQLTNIK